jgi:hypothetical protein
MEIVGWYKRSFLPPNSTMMKDQRTFNWTATDWDLVDTKKPNEGNVYLR